MLVVGLLAEGSGGAASALQTLGVHYPEASGEERRQSVALFFFGQVCWLWMVLSGGF